MMIMLVLVGGGDDEDFSDGDDKDFSDGDDDDADVALVGPRE